MLSAAAAAIVGFAVFATFNPISPHNVVEAAPGKVTQGVLRVLSQKGEANLECPLKRTDVQAEISGSLARVNVTQEFQNPLGEKIEAVYVFPLPQNAAVDDMTMQVGDRTVKGKIKRREEARAIYDAARQAGQVAGLLDQERPNIFTQSVANITPGATVKVTISYVEFLKYDEGTYEFVFPMVVGPRYIPGAAIGQQSTGFAPDTSQVPDASRITPKVAPAGTRAGHDISLNLTLDAGVPIDSLRCASHEVNTTRPAGNQAVVQLRNEAVIPNKDFVLKFDVAGRKISDAILTHRGLPHTNGGGFFSMIFQPPDRVTAADVTPKELVFVLDTSGSMHGFPIEKAKETMALALDALYPGDTFNLITFAGDTHLLFPQPRPATRENLRLAQSFLASRQGSGGTEMMAAIRAALEPSDKQDHVRIVCFMTDGYVGNDMEILSEVQKHPNARVFSFGIGSSVNRFLLDKMAEASRGEVEYVALTDDGSAAAKRFHERVRNPLMTDIELDWSGLPVADVYPKRLPDLFSAKPLILTGRYTAGARGVVRLKGRLAGQVFTREIPVELPETQPQHDVLATLWARTRIDDLMSHDYAGIQNGNPQTDVREAITQLGLEYRLMTRFTSFVAVEETVITDGGQPRRIDVPVELPEGVSREGVFGEEDEKRSAMKDAQQVLGLHKLNIAPYAEKSRWQSGPPAGSAMNAVIPMTPPPPSSTPIPENAPTSIHLSEGVLAGSATRKPKPAYPAIAKSARVSGAVQVQVTVNESGQVVDAKVIGGHPLLHAAALDAARQWTFKPAELSGKPVKASGIIRFNFNGGQPAATSGASRPLTPLPEEQRRQQALAKLHPSVAAVVARLASGAAPAADEARFVSNGKAEVQIRLRDKSAATIEQLKRLGVEVLVNSSASKTIVGRLPIGKLMALAELAVVSDVAPLTK
jgi:Ca-activated chloride channel family protein